MPDNSHLKLAEMNEKIDIPQELVLDTASVLCPMYTARHNSNGSCNCRCYSV
jgi:hypothetical protein